MVDPRLYTAMTQVRFLVRPSKPKTNKMPQPQNTSYQDRVDLVLARATHQYIPGTGLTCQVSHAMESEFGKKPSERELAQLVEDTQLAIETLSETQI